MKHVLKAPTTVDAAGVTVIRCGLLEPIVYDLEPIVYDGGSDAATSHNDLGARLYIPSSPPNGAPCQGVLAMLSVGNDDRA